MAKEKVVLITGASSGIGEASAKTLVNNGHKVILTARSEDKLAELVERERELEGKVIRLTPSSLDRDFLEERGRKILNFGHDNDIVIVIQNQSKKS